MKSSSRIGTVLDQWILFVSRYAAWVLTFFLLLSAIAVNYTITHIGINTNTDDMLSDKLSFRQIRKDYFESFPYHKNAILVVINHASSAELQSAVNSLTDALVKNTDRFDSVSIPGAGKFFSTHRLLYLDQRSFMKFSADLTHSSSLLTQLAIQPSASKLLSLLGPLTQDPDYTGNQIVTNILGGAISSLETLPQGRANPINWNQIFLSSQAPTHQRLILIEPAPAFRNVLSTGDTLTFIKNSASQLNISPAYGFQMNITGSLPMAYAELNSVRKGMGTAGLIAFILVVLLLWFGTRSFKILLFSLLTLLIGLSLTAGFATVAIGSLNLISVAFAVLYIGLGIDFSIHFCLRYQELLTQQKTHIDALRATGNDVGVPLLVCAVSTAIGFYAFVPTDFVGLSELGIISGTGMFISLLVSLSVLPALFQLSPIQVGSASPISAQSNYRWLSCLITKYRQYWLTLIILLTLASLYIAPQAYFDYDLLNMRDQQSESVAAFRKLVADKQHSPLHLSVLVDSYPEMLKLQTKLQVLDSVDKVLSINSLLPSEQTVRLRQLQGLSSGLPHTNLANRASTLPTLQGTTLSELQQALSGINETKQLVLYQQLSLFIARLKDMPQDRSERVLRQLDMAMMGNFSASLKILRQNLNVEKITLESLPRLQRRQWLSPITERYLLLIYPATSISKEKDLREFVDQVQEIAPRVTDTPAISLAAGDVAVSAFKQALLTAIILISLLLWVIYKDLKKTILILTPLLLAALFTTALSVVLGIPFNFSNLIAIPLLLGIGVDNGIHMVSRDHAIDKQQHILHTSTTRAVILSAFTTIVSFGNLGFSSHPGTASMGQLLTLGVSITLLCTLLVLPILLTKSTK